MRQSGGPIERMIDTREGEAIPERELVLLKVA